MPDPTTGVATTEIKTVQLNPEPQPSEDPPETYDLSKPIVSLPNGLAIREHRHSDAQAMAKHASNFKIARNMTNRWPHPYTVDKAHDWIAKCRDRGKWVAIGPTDPKSKNSAGLGQKLPFGWVITLNGEVIGGCGCNFKEDVWARTVMLGYWLGEEFWGRGYMGTLLPVWINWIWETYPWLVKIEAGTYGWNPASGKVLLKSGFQLEGRQRCCVEKAGVFGDLMLYGLVKEGVVVTGEAPSEP